MGGAQTMLLMGLELMAKPFLETCHDTPKGIANSQPISICIAFSNFKLSPLDLRWL